MTTQQTQLPLQQLGSGSRVEWAEVPRVNLLPPEIIEARRFHGTRRLLGGALVVTLLVAGAATAWAQHDAASAQDQLTAVTADTARLQAEQRKYAEVPRVLAQLDSIKSARAQALGTDVLWYRFLDDLATAIPASVQFTTISVSIADAAAPTAAAADPLTVTGIGSVTLAGTAARYPDVATWLTRVGAVHGLDASSLQSATQGSAASSATSPPIDFSTQVVITADALSHRYDQKAD